MRGVLFLILACLPAIAACRPTVKPDLHAAEPLARNAAAMEAGDKKDLSAVPHLITMLESDDAATRLVGIETLERITGERFGYEISGRWRDRRAAVARWRAWAQERGLTAEDASETPGG